MSEKDERTRRAVRDALNGDYDNVDPALRRALFAISTELDEHAVSMEAKHMEIMEQMRADVERLDARIGKVQTLLLSTTVTFIIAMGTGLLNLLLN